MSLRRFVFGLAFLFVVSPAVAAGVPPESFSDLHWRLVGPFRAGWATCAAGIPGKETFYIGTADGGVWKSPDAGITWQPLFDREASASIGALEIAPGDPRILYAGTGQVTTRWDIVSGTGFYRSRDGGKTWEQRGLAGSRHIGRILVDPRNPEVVLVAALGPFFKPGGERGVYRSTDGGGRWERVLAVDDNTGATDLASDPAAPDVIYASFWQARGWPWLSYFTPNVGPGSGIFKSTDGGKTWTRLSGRGLPEIPMGRIGLAVAPGSRGARVYATIDGAGIAGLYRSDDGGANWQRVNSTASLAGAYFASLTVDPRDPDTVYVMGQSIRRSTDGGKTFGFVRGAPGGDDYHFLWIDPEHPERMITASDQGASVTVNGGESWSSWYNQPTGQFYHLAADDRFPYWIYSGQQDSGTVALASRSDYGQLTFRDWHPVGGEERDYDIPLPGNPDIVFGTGLGGKVTRWDARTGQVQTVSPWPISSYGQRPGTVRYRSSWISPLAISPVAPHAIYLGAQVLFRSIDQGLTWEIVSPDLTGEEAGAEGCAGDVPVERARACGYGTISTIAPSPLEKDRIWIGTDSGKIQLTRDSGKTWQDVTPRGLPEWSRVGQIDASPTSPGTAYAAVDRHRSNDFRPSLYIPHDDGKTWREARAGLPADAWVGVVRQDRVAPGLLFAGTRRGVFVSFDDGGSWQPLQAALPTTGINDLLVHGDDLIAATEGRAIWALDDITPLRHLSRGLPAGTALLPPAPAYRLAGNQNRDTPLPVDEPRALNPPAGAVIDYVLGAAPRGPVTLEIADARGQVVRRFRSDETPVRPPSNRYFSEEWEQPLEPLPARAGHNRFVWNLRLPRPRALDYEYTSAAVPGADTPQVPQGMFVPPGKYTVRLTVDGRASTQPLEVRLDPRSDAAPADLEALRAFYDEVVRTLERVTDAQERVNALDARLKSLEGEAAKRLAAELDRFAKEDKLDDIAGVLGPLATDLEAADRRPTGPQREVLAMYQKRFETALGHWQAIADGPLKAADAAARKAGLPPLVQ